MGFSKTIYKGWNDSFMISSPLMTAIIVPQIGGRIMHYGPGDHNFLWTNERLYGKVAGPIPCNPRFDDWFNFGGDKTWPAPQGWNGNHQWPGPPDQVIDGGSYHVCHTLPDTLTVISELDPLTGLIVSRKISLGDHDTSLVVSSTFTNKSNKITYWAPWHITQLAVDVAGSLYIPLNQQSRYSHGFQVLFGDTNNPQWVRPSDDLLRVDYHGKVGKIGVDSTAGWLAFVAGNNAVFCQRFEPQLDQLDKYPDQGATVECWTMGDGVAADFDWGTLGQRYLEAEVLSPMSALGPGEQKSLEVTWNYAHCPPPITNVTHWGCVNSPPVIEQVNSRWHISGCFGVFSQAKLVLEGKSHSGWHPCKSWQVSPNNAVELNEWLDQSKAYCDYRLRLGNKLISL